MQLLGDGPEHDIKERPSARHKQSIKTERRVPSPFGSTISDKPLNQDPNRLEGECTTRDQLDRTTDGRGSQSQAGRPLTVCVEAKQLPPTSGGNQERPREGGA